MYYTSKSIRLVSKLQIYLEFIQRTNNRYEDKRSTLARYDACKDSYHPLRLMNTRYGIIEQMERWERLSTWLVIRYQNVVTELNEENIRQLRKAILNAEIISNNEVSTIEL